MYSVILQSTALSTEIKHAIRLFDIQRKQNRFGKSERERETKLPRNISIYFVIDARSEFAGNGITFNQKLSHTRTHSVFSRRVLLSLPKFAAFPFFPIFHSTHVCIISLCIWCDGAIDALFIHWYGRVYVCVSSIWLWLMNILLAVRFQL